MRVCIGIMVGVLASFGCASGSDGLSRSRYSTQRPAPPSVELPPLPAIAEPVASEKTLSAVYRFVGRHPEVARYIPCFCGCEKKNHTGVEDCFITERAADGGVTWNPHGGGCAVCVEVARDAMTLWNEGQSVEAIRKTVEERYKKQFITPTPHPPRAGSGGDHRHTSSPGH